MIYYIETNLIAIVIGMILLVQGQKASSRNETSQIIMSGMLLTLLALSASDIAAYFFRGWSYIGSQIADTVYYIAMAAGTYLWFFYILVKTGFSYRFGKRKMTLVTLPIFLLCLALLTNPFTGFFFTIDEQVIYHRGVGVPLTWVIEWGYMFAAVGINIKAVLTEPRSYRRSELRGYLYYVVPMAAAAVCQMLFYGITTLQTGYILALLLVFLNQQHHQVQRDDLTGLSNRNAFLNYRDSMTTKSTPSELTLFMIDADYFKIINDTYGHLKGDQALRDISTVLKRAAGVVYHSRLLLFRYGGDEFLALGKDLSAEERGDFQCAVSKQLDEMNRANRAKGEEYTLSLSIGIATMQCSDLNDFNALLSRADEEMYLIKRNRKTLR